MIGTWSEHDERLADECRTILPDRIFDAHAHLYDTATWESMRGYEAFSPEVVTLEVYRQQMDLLTGGREVHGMFFPYPVKHRSEEGFRQDNEWVARQIASDPLSCGQMLVRPQDDPDWVSEEMARLGLRGLKPFATYGTAVNSWEAEIPDFLPEPLAAAADRGRWSITLHMMRYAGPADPSNQYWIRRYCERYPNMILIIDHCGRGFNSRRAYRGLEKLADLANLRVDASVVCDPFSIAACFAIFGPERVFYGSDYCMSHFRGINFGAGDTFLWIGEESSVWSGHGHAPHIAPTLVGVENLQAIKAAAWLARLSDCQVEAFFWDNACGLLG